MNKTINCEKGLLSIVIPVYNVEPYLRQCIESVLGQTYPEIEIIIVDDGSTDGCAKICDEYDRRDERVRVFHKKNGGLSSARNLGLRYARGEFIGFVDSDDYIDLDMYESMIEEMEEGVDIVTCARYVVSPSKRYRKNQLLYSASQSFMMNRITAIEELLKGTRVSFSVCDKVFRKKLFENTLFPVGRTSEDIPVTYDLFWKSKNVVHIGKPKYYNFCRENSISRSGFYMRRIDLVLFVAEICKDIRVKYPLLSERAEALYVSYIVYTLKNIRTSKCARQYRETEKRLRLVLRRMCIRITMNSYITRDKKKEYLTELF